MAHMALKSFNSATLLVRSNFSAHQRTRWEEPFPHGNTWENLINTETCPSSFMKEKARKNSVVQ
jgi:hypothetical protein